MYEILKNYNTVARPNSGALGGDYSSAPLSWNKQTKIDYL